MHCAFRAPHVTGRVDMQCFVWIFHRVGYRVLNRYIVIATECIFTPW